MRRFATSAQVFPREYFLLLLLVASVLSLGTVHPESLLSLGFLAVASLLVYPLPKGSQSPTTLCLAITAYCCVQACPLPISWVERLSPQSALIQHQALAPFGVPPPHLASLSIDRGASLIEALKWTIYGITFLHAQEVGARRGSAFICSGVFFSGACLAAITLVHQMLGLKAVYGLYTPAFNTEHWSASPLINPNNLSGYLNLASFAGLGVLLSQGATKWRAAIVLGLVLTISQSALTGSRAGLLCLLGGALVLLITLRWFTRHRQTIARASLLLGSLLGGGLVLAYLGVSESVWEGLQETGAEKLELNVWSWNLLKSFPWFGVGAGAFASAIPAFGAPGENTTFTHPENFITGWLVEFGIPVGACLVALFLWLFRGSELRAHRNITRGSAFIGLLVLLAQNLLDLAFSVPGVFVAACTLAGGLRGSASRENSGLPSRFHPAISPVLIATGIFIEGLALLFGHPSEERSQKQVAQELEKLDPTNSAQRKAFFATLRGAMERHPGDPYFPRVGALVSLKGRDREPLPWIAHALRLSPQDGRTHLLLAHMLADRGVLHQALLELRLAATYAKDLRRLVVPPAVAWTRDSKELRQIVPQREAGVVVLIELGRALDRDEEWDASVAFLREAAALDPSSSAAHGLLTERLLSALEKQLPTCAQNASNCTSEASKTLASLRRVSPDDPRITVAHARLLALTGKGKQAVEYLKEHCPAETPTCISRAISISAHEGLPLQSLAASFVSLSCADHDKCIEAHRWLGDTFSKRKELGSALVHYRNAAQLESTAKAWIQVARLALRMRDHMEARHALKRAVALDPDGEDTRRTVTELESHLPEAALRYP